MKIIFKTSSLTGMSNSSFQLLTNLFLILRSGAFIFMIMNQVFANMSAVDLFIRRKALFM